MKKYEFYKRHDKGMAWQDEKRKIANGYGFLSISQCYEFLYSYELKSTSEIAEIFDVSKHCIRVTLLKMGVKMRGRGGPRNHVNFKKEDIHHIRQSKAESKYLAKHYGCTSVTINNIKNGRHWVNTDSLQ